MSAAPDTLMLPAHSRDAAALWRRLCAIGPLADAAPLWLQFVCARISGAETALLVRVDPATGAVQPSAHWPASPAPDPALTACTVRCLQRRQGQCEWQPGDGGRLALPIDIGGQPLAAVVVTVAVNSPALLPPLLAELQVLAGWLGQRLADERLRERLASESAHALVLELLERIAPYRQAADAALVLVNAIAERFGAKRVALGRLQGDGDRLRLLALSHTARFDARSQLVQAIENALEEALDQQHGVVLPVLTGRPTGLTLAHRALVGETGVVASAVLAGRGPLGCGALLIEREPGRPFTASECAQLDALGALIGPVLEDKAEAERWLAGRPAALLRSARQALADPRRPSLRLGLAAAVLALAGLLWWPSDWRVTADAVVEGAQQRAIAAPFEGYIGSALHRAGETVAAGTVIATLDERTLRLEHARWSAESAQHDKRLRDALSRHDRPAAGLARAGLDQAEAQLALVEQRLERARLVSPFPAVIVSGDLSQQIGSPVEQGKVLFELAPLDAWRVILKVDERDIRAVAPGQRGRLVLSGLSGETIPFHVLNIAMPEAGEGRNRFRVEAALDGDSPRLRPGMEGVGKIEVGERSLAWIWTHKAIDWLRLELWRLWP